MSTIDKLMIRGIRSFGVDKDDEQGIRFNSPLSLIVGANGCGKTTIIECLKYALTGEMPPGSNKGQSFVHDPKMSNYAECLGQVRLRVRTIKGDHITVTRSMKTSLKKFKLSFETLDSMISANKDGKEVTVSKRNADANTEMCMTMGVSKAILNNVIFCHQEDSSWPLDEQKKLKEKFDAIFGTTEYNKAIDKLMKVKKEYNARKLEREGDLKIYKMNKSDGENKQLDLENLTEKSESLNKLTSKLDEEMNPIKVKLEEIRKVEINVSKCVAERVEIKTNLSNCQEQQGNLKAKIKSLKTDKSSEDLKIEIRDYKEQVDTKKDLLRNKERTLEKNSSQGSKLQAEINSLKSQSGTLLYKRQMEQELTASRAKKVQKLCKDLGVDVEDDLENSPDSLSPIFEEMKSAFKNEENSIQKLTKNHEKRDEEFQEKIDVLRSKIATIETEISTKKDQVKQARKDEQKIQYEVEEIENSARLLKKLTVEIEAIEEEYEKFQKDVNLDTIQSDLDKKKSTKSKLEIEMEKLDDQIHILNSLASVTNKIALLEQQLEEKDSEVERLRNKHQSGLKTLLDNKKITSNYRRSVLNIQDELNSEKKRLMDELKKKQLRFVTLQSNRKNQADNVKKIKTEISDLEEKVYEQCGSGDFDETLEKMKENLEKTQLEFGAVKSSEALYKKYLGDLKDHPGCPLCHKQMSSKEQSDLTSELHDEIVALPNKISKMEVMLKKERSKHDALLSLKPSVERLEKLKADIAEEDIKLKNMDKTLKDNQTELEELEIKTTEPDSKLEIIQGLIGDMTVLDDGLRAIEKLKIEIDKIKSTIPKHESTLSLEDAQIEKSAILAEVKNLRSEIDRMERDLNTKRKKFNEICERKNQTKAKQLKLQEGVQALSQLKDRLQEITNQITSLTADISKNEENLRPTREELSKITKEKQKIKEENRQTLEVARKRLSSLKDLNNDIMNDNQTLQQYAEENLELAIQRLQSKIKNVQTDLKEKQTEIQSLTDLIESIRMELAEQAVIERDLMDNLELKKLEQEENVLSEKLSNLKKLIDESDYNRLDKERKDLLKKQDDITAKRGELIGQQSELRAQIKRIQSELNEPRYKNAMKSFQSAFYEVEVIKQAINDLTHHRTALEWALLKYHSEHMEKINELIREFWRDIYRGNDIDYVQIRTDEQTSSDRRKNYNYRVVQCKNGTEIDMRGRCSAGQRVLASIIIRMALAETFSSNCGVLALDEPTTNLDKDNIESLCLALRKIIEARKTHHNFMLLIITHDEDFVRSLGNIEVFYKISRNAKGKSVIDKFRTSDMH